MRSFGPGALLAIAAGLTACEDGGTVLAPVAAPRDAGCAVEETARTFEVFFVVDVSRSMQSFLDDLASELSTLALNFPERDAQDRRTLVTYRVVAFVNDVKLFPEIDERMTSHIAVASAIREAIAAAQGNRNLRANTPNADDDENLLDALGEVIARSPSADTVLVILATDAGFRELGSTLSGGVIVSQTYDAVRSGLEALGARVYALVPGNLDGLTRGYRGQPALTTLPGSQVFDLTELAEASDQIRETLTTIARSAACAPTPSS